MSGNDKEIPEELFRKDFGGAEFERHREKRRSDRVVAMTFNGLLFALLGPLLLGCIAGVIAYVYYCGGGWGSACKF